MRADLRFGGVLSLDVLVERVGLCLVGLGLVDLGVRFDFDFEGGGEVVSDGLERSAFGLVWGFRCGVLELER